MNQIIYSLSAQTRDSKLNRTKLSKISHLIQANTATDTAPHTETALREEPHPAPVRDEIAPARSVTHRLSTLDKVLVHNLSTVSRSRPSTFDHTCFIIWLTVL
jgi:hypothetical protein